MLKILKFDAIVAAAMINGKKIAFRCTAGAHRTGRLAAYYELKYKNMELEAALKNLEQYGFVNFPSLKEGAWKVTSKGN